MAKKTPPKASIPAPTPAKPQPALPHLQVNIAVDEAGVRIIHPYSDGEIVKGFDSSHQTRVREGLPVPLGATWDGLGVNFALFSANATKVELCLFNDQGEQYDVIELPEYTDEVWHGYLPDARPGLLYAYRVHGPYAPHDGHRFNPAKLLLDPYAKQIVGELKWDDALFAYDMQSDKKDLHLDNRDSAEFLPKCRVIDPAFSWARSRKNPVPWEETLIYETHVRGYTMRHPAVPEHLRGTFGPEYAANCRLHKIARYYLH